MKKTLLATAAIAVAFLATVAPASAAPITGSINLVGDFQPMDNGSNTQNLAQADRIDFLPNGGGTGSFMTGSANADLAPLAFKTGGVIKDLDIDPFAPVTTFYTITFGGTTLTFDLTALSIVNQNATFLTMMGTGTMYLTGFDATPGNFNFSGQSSNGASPQATFSWSAGSTATGETQRVPEPMSLALLGLGLLGAGALRRRKTA